MKGIGGGRFPTERGHDLAGRSISVPYPSARSWGRRCPSRQTLSQERLEIELEERWHKDTTATASLGKVLEGHSTYCCCHHQAFPALLRLLGCPPAAHGPVVQEACHKGSRSYQPSTPPITSGEGFSRGPECEVCTAL